MFQYIIYLYISIYIKHVAHAQKKTLILDTYQSEHKWKCIWEYEWETLTFIHKACRTYTRVAFSHICMKIWMRGLKSMHKARRTFERVLFFTTHINENVNERPWHPGAQSELVSRTENCLHQCWKGDCSFLTGAGYLFVSEADSRYWIDCQQNLRGTTGETDNVRARDYVRLCRHCNTLQRAVKHYSTLRYVAVHCSTLQHVGTLCNTL